MSDSFEHSLNAVRHAYSALDDKMAVDVTMLDIHNISVISDYFIIATGNNPNHVKALAEEVSNELAKNGFVIKHSEGYQTSTWILLDFGCIIVHIFNKEDRSFYNLERIWGDAEPVTPESLKA